MTLHVNLSNQPRPVAAPGNLLPALRARLSGPGGYYNLGNLLGLFVSLALQAEAALRTPDSSLQGLLREFFAGSPAALALTAATVVFLIGGKIYHRAWTSGSPDQRLNRIADSVSTLGALLLSLALILLGHTGLAIVSGLLIAGGKLGSALTGDDPTLLPLWPLHWPDPFRLSVLIGRGPGLVAALLDLLHRLLSATGATDAPGLINAATLAICYLLWIKADLLLIEGASRRLAIP